MNSEQIFEAIVEKRGITDVEEFVNPTYEKLHDPMLLPDINDALKRIKQAKKGKQKVVVYGDYDIDGLTATTILVETLTKLGIDTTYYMPDRFKEGYGMSKSGIDSINKMKASLVITVDCGSRSIEEIGYAKENGIDVIVTDHHELGDKLPEAVAVINPKRKDSKYPWKDLAGVGVAFKLIQALQTQEEFRKDFPNGQEKWLLDLVALGTVCDVVDLIDENRILTWWGLKVLSKTRRSGLKALASVSGTDIATINSMDLGFRFGPRLNASGRLDHAELSLNLLMSTDVSEAKKIADQLNEMNQQRQKEQKRIFFEALEQAKKFDSDNVLVLADKSWSHGINGIVASKLVESLKKPTFVLQVLGDETKGSARSFGDFDLAESLQYSSDVIGRGGGHKAAAGVTLKTKDIDKFRSKLNEFYESKDLSDQTRYLRPESDVELSDLSGVEIELVDFLDKLAPFGHSNQQPTFSFNKVTIQNWKPVGADQSHAKATFQDKDGNMIDGIGFGLAKFMPDAGEQADILFVAEKNEFNSKVTVQARIISIKEVTKKT